jgi:ketose-bisphosphate aldolase
MPLISFHELMAAARRGQYAVGYFESWNLESLLAVADAAEKMQSPVILGYSGIYLPHSERKVCDALAPYAALALDVCQRLSVPTCLLYNESPHLEWVHTALALGFNLVMFSDERLSPEFQLGVVEKLADRAHQRGAAVEAEMQPLSGVGGDLPLNEPADRRMTDPEAAAEFVRQTGIDAIAVNVGQCHFHGRRKVRLDFDRLAQLSQLPVPLVLHGATSVEHGDLRAAVKFGVRKINVGSLLKQAYFQALRSACSRVPENYNPYEVLGSSLDGDVLVAARLAMQSAVEELMVLFGSAGQA